jgi:hypothetical protein
VRFAEVECERVASQLIDTIDPGRENAAGTEVSGVVELAMLVLLIDRRDGLADFTYGGERFYLGREEGAGYFFGEGESFCACTKTYKSVELYEIVQGGYNG